MKRDISYLKEKILLITVFCIAVSLCSAQTIDDNIINLIFTEKIDNTERFFIHQSDKKEMFTYPNYIVKPFSFHEYNMKKDLFKDLYSNNSSLNKQNMSYKDFYNASYFIEIRHKCNLNNWGINLFYAENSYINLLNRRSTILSLNYQKNNLFFETNLMANRYETKEAITQFGVAVFLEYQFSPYWFMAVWGTMYSNNHYFSMAAMPFVETSSYGSWLRYQNNGYGLKLGARRYFDSFQKKWKTEPIVTPSVKLGRKIVFELPIGPLVQKSMERLLKKSNKGPNIMPDF